MVKQMKRFKVFFSKSGLIHRTGQSHRYGSCDNIQKFFIPINNNIGDYKFCKNCLKDQTVQQKVVKLLKSKIRVDQVNSIKSGNKVHFEEVL